MARIDARVPDELKAAVARIAECVGMTTSDVVRVALYELVQRYGRLCGVAVGED